MGVGTPETDLDAKLALIRYYDITSVLHLAALLDVDLSKRADVDHDANSVDGPHLLKVVYLPDGDKAEAPVLNAEVVIDFFNLALLVKHDGVIVFYARVLLVRHLHLAVRKQIDFVLLQDSVVVVCLIVEECTLDLCTLAIYQFDIQ